MGSKGIFDRIGNSHIFEDLPNDLIKANLSHFQLKHYNEGDVILREGDINSTLHIIHSGEAHVLKTGSKDGNSNRIHRIATLAAGEEFGEMTAIDNSEVSATIRAAQPLELISIDLQHGQDDPGLKRLCDQLQLRIGRRIANRLRDTNKNKVEVMEREIESRRAQAIAGRFIITVMTLSAGYTLALRAVLDLNIFSWMEVYFSPVIILAFMGGVLFMMVRSEFPFEFFGITTKGWRAAIIDALKFSIPFCIILTLLKGAYILFASGTADMSLFTTADMFSGYFSDGSFNWFIYLGFMGAYMLLSPVQELIGRCGVQAPLFSFLQGSPARRHFLSILVSNLMSAAAHSHLNLAFAIATFIPGIFWGWLFMRNKSIIGVSVSHALIGSYALFALGLEEFLK